MLGIREVVAPDTTSMPGKICATVYLSGDILKVMHNACYNIEKKAKKHEIDTILAVAEEALDPSENIIQILVEIARQYKLRLHIRVLKKVVKEKGMKEKKDSIEERIEHRNEKDNASTER